MRDISRLQEVTELNAIVSSRAYRRVLEKHALHLQKEANRCIREQKWTEAFANVAKIDDLTQILKMVELELKEAKGGK